MQKQQKKKKKRAVRIRRAILVMLLLTIALVCFCLFAPFFNITSIEVEGNVQVTSEEILDRVNLVTGTNIFKINKNSIREGLRTLAYLDTVKVSRRLPSTVKISVTECYAELLAPYTSGYLLLDSKGKVLEQISDSSGWDLPELLGVSIEKAEISEKISVQDGVKFDIIFNCIEYFKSKEQLSLISSFDFNDITNIQVTYREGYRVNFAKLDDMDYKMKMLEAILPQIDRSPGTYIDLTTPSKVFAGREEASPSPSAEPESSGEAETDKTGQEPDGGETGEKGEEADGSTAESEDSGTPEE